MKNFLASFIFAIIFANSFLLSIVHAQTTVVNINNYAVQGGFTVSLSSEDIVQIKNGSNLVQLQYNFLNLESAKSSSTNYVSMQPNSLANLGCNKYNNPATVGYLLVVPKDLSPYTFVNPNSLPASQVLNIRCLPPVTPTPAPTTAVPTAKPTTVIPTVKVTTTTIAITTNTTTVSPSSVVANNTTTIVQTTVTEKINHDNDWWILILIIIIIMIFIITTLYFTYRRWRRIVMFFREVIRIIKTGNRR